LQTEVYFLGKQDKVADLISIADLMLLPSEKESFGLVALEAMACGVPVVASNTGGIPELVQHGKTGFVAPIGEISTMARHALQLLQNEQLHATFRETCIQAAQTLFSAESIVAHYEQLYDKVMKGSTDE
jgi:glycosyltransferase involved in cell wall biosynthesis